MTTAFVASYISLWVVVVLLALVLVALARQIGVLHGRLGPVGARIANTGPAIGEVLTSFVETDIFERSISIPDTNRNTLLLFVSPGCPMCDQIAPAVRSFAKDEKRKIRIVLASFNGDAPANQAYATERGLDDISYVLSKDLALRLGVLSVPYAVLIDVAGVVRSKGLVNNREHLESLVNVLDQGYASIQAFWNARDGVSPKPQLESVRLKTEQATLRG